MFVVSTGISDLEALGVGISPGLSLADGNAQGTAADVDRKLDA